MHRAIGFVRAHCAVVAISIALIVFSVVSASASGSSPDRSTAMQSLDQQVQDIKPDVLKSTNMKAPNLATRVVERVKTFDFGAKEGIPAVTIIFPIAFLPATWSIEVDRRR
jgi:hypothetical protein